MRAGSHPRFMRAGRFLILVPALFLFVSCTGHVSEEPSIVQKVGNDTLKIAAEALRNIQLTQAREADFPDRLSLMGRISIPEDRVTVIPARVAARIDGVFVATGETVKTGQVVANLFSADYAVAREEYLQALKQSAGGSPEGRQLASLARKKLESIGLNGKDIEALPAQSSDTASSNFMVRATRGGVVIDKKAIVGNFVNQGDTLFTIGDISKVWFQGDLYPEDLPKVHKDQELVIEPAFEGEATVFGKVSFISPVVDPTTRTVKIRALMDNPGKTLRADMYVRGFITLSKRTALVIPSKSIVRFEDKPFVFKKLGDDRFQRTAVTLGGEQNGMTAITTGLVTGDSVVSEGGLLLQAALDSSGT